MATMKDINNALNKDLSLVIVDKISDEKAIILTKITILLYNAIVEEQGLPPTAALIDLPRDTVLGPKAEALFNAFREQLPS